MGTAIPDGLNGTALLRLLTWLSPAFPVGAFAYSHGLERAIAGGLVRDRETLLDWLSDLIAHGSSWNDAVLLAQAWRTADVDGGEAAAELAEAMSGSRERHLETMLQGGAFGDAMGAWKAASSGPAAAAAAAGQRQPYPVAVGVAAARHGVALEHALVAFLHAFTSNLVQAAVRLVPLGQRDGLATLAALEPLLLATAGRAALSSLDDLGSCTTISDIMSMSHETQYSRVFRT